MRTTSTRRVYTGKVLALDVDEIEDERGEAGRREVVRQSGSVAALPVHEDGRVVLVRQHRHAVGEALWELPAGRRDGEERPEDGASRELEEETGLRAAFLEPIADFYTTPGFCDERMWVFRATGLTAGEPRPEADERIEVRAFGFEEVRALLRAGEIREGKTLVALLLEVQRRAGAG